MEQMQFEEISSLTKETVLTNREKVVDFFGDNRAWYEKLLAGGQRFGRTSLDSQKEFDADGKGDEDDLPPLDPSRITEERAVTILSFFQEYPEAQKAFTEYANL